MKRRPEDASRKMNRHFLVQFWVIRHLRRNPGRTGICITILETPASALQSWVIRHLRHKYADIKKASPYVSHTRKLYESVLVQVIDVLVTDPAWICFLNFHNDRQDHRSSSGLFIQKSSKCFFDMCFQ